jgi:choline kinase
MNTQTKEALKMLDAMRLSYSDLIYNKAGFEKAEEFEDAIIAVKEAIATNEESSVVQPAQEPKHDAWWYEN